MLRRDMCLTRRSTTASFGGAKEEAFAKILQKLAKGKTRILMMNAIRLKVHRMAADLRRGLRRGTLGEPKVDLSKLHAVCDGLGRPVRLLLTAGNVSDIV
jgi:hypothetical protein